MPAHYPSPFDEKKMWDVVNFVLALPYEPDLLKDAPPPPPTASRRGPGGRSRWSVVSSRTGRESVTIEC